MTTTLQAAQLNQLPAPDVGLGESTIGRSSWSLCLVSNQNLLDHEQDRLPDGVRTNEGNSVYRSSVSKQNKSYHGDKFNASPSAGVNGLVHPCP